MSWIIQWLGCTPKVSALWPLWQEVKGRAVAAGINEADMFRYGPESVGEWQRKLTHLKKNPNSYTHLPLVCFNATCINCSRSLCKMWPLNPDSQNESFSLLFQQRAVLLQNPCVSRNNVSNLSHKRGQSQYAREWRQIPNQRSHRKLSYVWLYVYCKWENHLIRYWVPHHYISKDLNYQLNQPTLPLTLKDH